MKITVEFDVEVPEEATTEQIQEWLDYELGGGSMKSDNPCRGDIEAQTVYFEHT